MQTLVAWHRQLPRGTAFAGFSCGWLNRIDVDPIHPIEVVVPPKSDVRSRPGLMVRCCSLADVVHVRGLPTTTLSRMFEDLSRRLPPEEILVLADQALKLGLGRFHDLAQPADSPMETRLRWLLIQSGLPAPEVQTDLYGEAGFVGCADLYYPSAHLVIEFDGGNHRERMVSDDRRQNLIVNAGYRVLRYTSADLRARPDAVVAQVRAALAGQAVSRSATTPKWSLAHTPSTG